MYLMNGVWDVPQDERKVLVLVDVGVFLGLLAVKWLEDARNEWNDSEPDAPRFDSRDFRDRKTKLRSYA